jgi:hypothetical protein
MKGVLEWNWKEGVLTYFDVEPLCKICFHGSNYEEYRLWDIKAQFVPHRRHITSLL